MKIKSDFVTNSSSTSFMLSINVIGLLSISEKVDLEKVSKILDPNNVGRYYEDSAYIECDNSVSIFLKQLLFPNEENNEIDKRKILINMVYISDYISSKGSTHPISYVTNQIKLFIDQPEVRLEDSKLIYTQLVHSFSGDGWNDGDPHGDYEYYHECIANETKFGLLSIKTKEIDIHDELPFKKFITDKLSFIDD